MKWVGISGGWRATNQKVEADVRETVRRTMADGNGIVSGGALGVDYMATDEALKLDPSASRIRVYLPAGLKAYEKHYRSRAAEGVITMEQAEALVSQLEMLKGTNAKSLIEKKGKTVVDKEAYCQRNTEVVEASDELVAFHINRSAGTQDTIDKARKKGLPVTVLEYDIPAPARTV